jgi:exodeoxyribonuclease V alpha subunit
MTQTTDIPKAESVNLHATVNRVIFHNKENGYTVISAKNGKGELTIVCYLPFTPDNNCEIQVEGEWIDNQKYGRQLKAKHLTVKEPTTEEGIIEYLSSGVISGIGPSLSSRIVATFGLKTLETLDKNPEKLLEINGVGQKTLNRISKSWAEKRESANVVANLTASFGLSVAYATKIYKHYGNNAISIIKENPYRIAEDVWGIGFKKADEVAMSIGFKDDHPYRVESGILYILNESMNTGHCYLPSEILKNKAIEMLKVNRGSVEKAIVVLQAKNNVTAASITREGDTAYYLSYVYNCEAYISKRIKELASIPACEPNSTDGYIKGIQLKKSLLEWERGLKQLTDEQLDAAKTAMSQRISVITGSAGTGKTTTLKAIIQVIEANEMTYALCAPTGKAAQRISEVTGKEAKTIHRLLEYQRSGHYNRNETNPLSYDYVIVDEASMVDLFLMHALLKAIKSTTRIVFIGDPNQLPPVGAGNVLKDIINSEVCAVKKLSVIKRQTNGSHVISVANSINDGIFPHIPNSGNVFFFQIENPDDIANKIVDLAINRIPEKFGIKFQDIQVLSPMKKGAIGTENLNKVIQNAVQKGQVVSVKGFMLYDRVMQVKNNYDKGVFNGDIGYIAHIDADENTVLVNYDTGESVEYAAGEADELKLAYCCTVHKFQGSESKCIIIPIHTQHYPMLKRDLLYTAVTRTQELLVVVGTKKAIAIGVKNNNNKERLTGLWSLLSVNSDDAINLQETIISHSSPGLELHDR